jgi:tartrate/fumarate subfamily iron-sulfur-dependent hydro-lyase beta chain
MSMRVHNLNLPVDDDCVEVLEIGDTVYLTGIVCTARDMAHLRIKRLLDDGIRLPIDWKGGAVIHAGPMMVKKEDKWNLSAIGPTTSIRMEPYAAMIGNLGVKLIVGKGGMADASLQQFSRHKQAYLQAPCGCAALLATGVTEVLDVHWLENGMPEAMWVLRVKRFGPFIVTMDSHGHSRYDELRESAGQIVATLQS